MRDLRALGGDGARGAARVLVGDWLLRQSNWHEVAWRPDVLGSRLFAWLGQHDFFCAPADDIYRQNYLTSLVRQAKHLSRVLPRGVHGEGLILAAKGLVAAGLALPRLLGVVGFDFRGGFCDGVVGGCSAGVKVNTAMRAAATPKRMLRPMILSDLRFLT